MEVEDIQVSKFPKISNGRNESSKIGGQKSGAEADSGVENRFHQWHHSSRIIRVSRASGGKDRHSKVWTSKGPRDRRVRLSVSTAIQFYDLQDRLGYDQPSKAVEWLIKAAADAIAELPSLNSFPETPKQLSDEQRGSTEQRLELESAEVDVDPGNYQQNQSQHLSLSKSACSSNSENSKNSGLSLSRPDVRVNRVKARERARERAGAAKEKEKEHESRIQQDQNSSFTELLTGGIGNNSSRPPTSAQQNMPNLFQKVSASRQWSAATPMDYFAAGGGLFGPSSSSRGGSGFPGQIQLGNSLPHTMSMSMSIPPFNISGENQHHHHHNQEMQHFSFVPDHLIPVATTQPGPGADYNLNFSISSGLSGFNRGTLQSNSPSLLPHLQRFSSSPIDGPSFFIGTPPVENHQFPAGFDGRLQLHYGDGSRNSDQKEKGKN